MAGLNEAGIDAIFASRPKPNPAAQPGALGMERADAIRGEIYRRHGIAPHRTLQEAIDRINMQAQMRTAVGNDGGELSAWENPEARETARAEYAAEGKSPQEVRQRHAASMHLLDPRSQQYMQDFGRDLDFLGSELESQEQSQRMRTPRRMLDANAIRFYDSNSGERLARSGGVYGEPLSVPQGGYQRWGGWQNALLNAVADPETPTGSYFTWAEIPAEAILTSAGGEAGVPADSSKADALAPAHVRWALPIARAFQDQEAWDRARARHAATQHYRTTMPSRVADFPVGSRPSSGDISRRIAELQNQVYDSNTPMASERWYRTTGYAPPGWLADTGENLVRWIDPSAALTLAGGAGVLAKAGRAAVPAVSAALARDAGQEWAFDAGMQGALGGEPGRSWRQYAVGGGKPGVDFDYKSPEQVDRSRRAGAELHRALGENERLSTAQQQAHDDLAERGSLGELEQVRNRMSRKLQAAPTAVQP
jgi:hypothetical protein